MLQVDRVVPVPYGVAGELAGAAVQFGEHRAGRPQVLAVVQGGGGEAEQARPGAVAAAVDGLGEAELGHGLQMAVDGRFRQAGAPGEIAQPVRPTGFDERFQHFHRLVDWPLRAALLADPSVDHLRHVA